MCPPTAYDFRGPALPRAVPRGGISLLELLIVVAIVAVLVALCLPAVQKARIAAIRTRSENNLRQIALAFHSAATAQGSMPPAAGFWPGQINWKADPKIGPSRHGPPGPPVLASWCVFLFPYVDAPGHFQTIQSGSSWGGGPGGKAYYNHRELAPPLLYRNPADPTAPPDWREPESRAWVVGYAANGAAVGAFGYKPPNDAPFTFTAKVSHRVTSAAGIPDGASNTVLLYERFALPGPDGATLEVEGELELCGNLQNHPWDPSKLVAPVLGLRSDAIGLTPQFQPGPSERDPLRAGSALPGIVLVALADGSVRRVGAKIEAGTWEAAQRPADGTVLGPDW